MLQWETVLFISLFFHLSAVLSSYRVTQFPFQCTSICHPNTQTQQPGQGARCTFRSLQRGNDKRSWSIKSPGIPAAISGWWQPQGLIIQEEIWAKSISWLPGYILWFLCWFCAVIWTHYVFRTDSLSRFLRLGSLPMTVAVHRDHLLSLISYLRSQVPCKVRLWCTRNSLLHVWLLVCKQRRYLVSGQITLTD